MVVEKRDDEILISQNYRCFANFAPFDRKNANNPYCPAQLR
jgi:hypothetical protein